MRIFKKSRSFIDIDEVGETESIPYLDREYVDGYGDGFNRQHSLERDDFSPYNSYGGESARMTNSNSNHNSRVGKRASKENDTVKHKQSIGELVRKLNCSASKKHNFEELNHHLAERGEIDYFGEPTSSEIYHNSPQQQKSPLSSPLGTEDTTPSESIRPVLITVNNGDVNEHVRLYDTDNNNDGNFYHTTREPQDILDFADFPEPTNMCTSPSFRLAMSARKRHNNTSKYFKVHDDQQEAADRRRAAQEAARRERWKRGFELERRMFKTGFGRGKYRDDGSIDSTTTGSYTTGTSTTGYDSSLDDWTDATEESDLAPRYYHQTSNGAQCTSAQLHNVAEDFGIIAKLLLSDGYACLGSAAQLTKETVGECKGDRR